MLLLSVFIYFFFFSSRRRHTIFKCDWSSDVCSSDLPILPFIGMVTLGVERLDETETVLKAAGNPVTRRGDILIAPFPSELGIGAWAFVQDAADLPWRARSVHSLLHTLSPDQNAQINP